MRWFRRRRPAEQPAPPTEQPAPALEPSPGLGEPLDHVADSSDRSGGVDVTLTLVAVEVLVLIEAAQRGRPRRGRVELSAGQRRARALGTLHAVVRAAADVDVLTPPVVTFTDAITALDRPPVLTEVHRMLLDEHAATRF